MGAQEQAVARAHFHQGVAREILERAIAFSDIRVIFNVVRDGEIQQDAVQGVRAGNIRLAQRGGEFCPEPVQGLVFDPGVATEAPLGVFAALEGAVVEIN